ncbi:ABC transporter substrate-binding protein [Streptomyces sp. V2I9]|uniref:ABC transporter substrate-binding protein n=1 Tax=Streptomyces sp. V2I9 TaxID=3042304 RepID=UPI0027898EB2|nr:ABC transporter substrate-binding protein [Streptomyces sp. V2I9]MDQ0988107.1 polar amino acid transport system substrate-binding protein [Streptomyces sp. V2I9]
MRRFLAGGWVFLLLLTGCADGDELTAATSSGLNLTPRQNRLTAAEVDEVAALVPERVRRTGVLHIGGTIDNTPPLSCYATDNKTPIGFELDIAVLIAGVMGLEPDREVTSWENMFLGVDSGKYDVALSNISVTEERMKTYDFASYRRDRLGFEAREGSDLKVDEPADLAGKNVALASGSTQEKIMLEWSAENREAGRPAINIQYYQKASDYYLALRSGRVDVYVGPSSSVVYHAETTGETELVGVVDSVTDTIDSQVGAMSRKDDGTSKAVAAAVNELIRNGKYQKVLDRWGLGDQKISESLVNPSVGEGA